MKKGLYSKQFLLILIMIIAHNNFAMENIGLHRRKNALIRAKDTYVNGLKREIRLEEVGALAILGATLAAIPQSEFDKARKLEQEHKLFMATRVRNHANLCALTLCGSVALSLGIYCCCGCKKAIREGYDEYCRVTNED